MPIKLNTILTEGWKTAPSQQQKRGQVLVVQFINEKSGKILFEYAPKHEDVIIFQEQVFPILEKLESIKELLKLTCEKPDKKITKKEKAELEKLKDE